MDLLVADLHDELTEQAIQTLFEVFGVVSRVKLIKDKKTGKSKRFGFVTMDNEEEALKAIEELNGKEIAGECIAVKVSTGKQKEPKPKQVQPEAKTPKDKPKKKWKKVEKSDGKPKKRKRISKTTTTFTPVRKPIDKKPEDKVEKEEKVEEVDKTPYTVNNLDGGYVKVNFGKK